MKFLSFFLLFAVSSALMVESEFGAFCQLARETNCMIDCIIGCGMCGIECTSDGHASAINLRQNLLSDIQANLTNFTMCRYVGITGNRFTHFPKALFDLQVLDTIDIAFNALSEIPTEIEKLGKLTMLFITDNQLTEIGDALSKNEALGVLHADNNKISKVDFSKYEKSPLTVITLDNNPDLTGITGISKLNSLESLSVRNCNLKTLPEGLNSLASLSGLALGGNKNLDISNLDVSEKLVLLYIENMGLKKLPAIVTQLNNLVGLDISHNSLTEFPTDYIVSSNKKFAELYVGNNSFSSFPTSLNHLSNLKKLHVQYTQGAKPALDALNIPSLIELMFDGVTGEFPQSIYAHTKLTYLSFMNCGYKEFPSDVMKLVELQDLFLSDNQIETLPDDWSTLTMLRRLSIKGNPITKYPQGLKKLTMLTMFEGSSDVFCKDITDFPDIFQNNCKDYNVFKQYFGVLLALIIVTIIAALVGFYLISFRSGKKRERKKASKKITDAEASQADNVEVDTSPENIGHNHAMMPWKVWSKKLTFISEGKLMDIGYQYSTDFDIENTSKEEMFFYILFPSRKNNYTVEVHPPYGDLEGGETMNIKVNMTLHCTTRVDEKMYVVMCRIRHCGMKEVKEHTTIQVLAQGKNSTRINYDDIHFEEVIGTGSFGVVSCGVWKGNAVAVKELKTISNVSRNDFMREVEILEQVRSPYILQFYGAVLTKERMCLVTEYMPYGSLLGVIRDFDLSASMRVRFMLDAVRGLYFLHTSSIMHRDVKTDNVLVCDLRMDASAVCKIADFGSSREVNADQTQLNMTKGIGTPYYMAPELLLGNKEYNFSADVYSIGVMLNEIWSQETPFVEHEFNGILTLTNFVVAGKRPTIRDDCPAALKEVIEHCWQHKPEARMETADVVCAIEEIFEEIVEQEGPEITHAKERSTSKRKHRDSLTSSGHRSLQQSFFRKTALRKSRSSSQSPGNTRKMSDLPVGARDQSFISDMGSFSGSTSMSNLPSGSQSLSNLPSSSPSMSNLPNMSPSVDTSRTPELSDIEMGSIQKRPSTNALSDLPGTDKNSNTPSLGGSLPPADRPSAETPTVSPTVSKKKKKKSKKKKSKDSVTEEK